MSVRFTIERSGNRVRKTLFNKKPQKKENKVPEQSKRSIVHRRASSGVPIIAVESCKPIEVPRVHRRTSSGDGMPPSEAKRRLVSQIQQHFLSTRQAPATSLQFYKIGRSLGTGAFGTVSTATHVLTGFRVAIKSINKGQLKSERERSRVMQEIFVMNRLRHPNISQLLEAFETPESILLVMEHVGGGDLLSLLKKRGALPETEAKRIFKQIVEAVQACHSKNIVHRDIKLDNVLLSNDHRHVKLCDFGVSRMIIPGETVDEKCGTPAYLAPEIISKQEYYPLHVDIWSLGVLLYALVTGSMPFTAHSIEELNDKILKCEFILPLTLTSQCKELISLMICRIPHLRISAGEILMHPWISDQTPVNQDLSCAKSVDDSTIFSQLAQMGFNEEFVIQGLRYKEINHATATFYLLKLYHSNKLKYTF